MENTFLPELHILSSTCCFLVNANTLHFPQNSNAEEVCREKKTIAAFLN